MRRLPSLTSDENIQLLECDDSPAGQMNVFPSWCSRRVVGPSTFLCCFPQHHTSNLFRDKQRVRAFSSNNSGFDDGGSIVVSVQFASPEPHDLWNASIPPFSAQHFHGANKRVRFVHVTDFALPGHRLDDNQARPRVAVRQKSYVQNRHMAEELPPSPTT